MTLFSRLGVSSDMAAPSCWPGCVWPPPVQPDSGPPALPNCAKDSVRHPLAFGALGHILYPCVLLGAKHIINRGQKARGALCRSFLYSGKQPLTLKQLIF